MDADAGKVAGLFLGSEPGGPILRAETVEAVAGQGLVGDRYFSSDGGHHPTQEITLFAQEDIEAARAESGLDIDELDLRRNVMTVGVDLTALVGGAVRIGDVVVDQLTSNPPCAHLQRLAGKQLLQPLVERGGLRGRIAQGGTIREGDPIEHLPRDVS
jgi:MOSC domain-containing protein YiiM